MTCNFAYVAAASQRKKGFFAFCARLAFATFSPFRTTACPALYRAERIVATIRMSCARHKWVYIKLHPSRCSFRTSYYFAYCAAARHGISGFGALVARLTVSGAFVGFAPSAIACPAPNAAELFLAAVQMPSAGRVKYFGHCRGFLVCEIHVCAKLKHKYYNATNTSNETKLICALSKITSFFLKRFRPFRIVSVINLCR